MSVRECGCDNYQWCNECSTKSRIENKVREDRRAESLQRINDVHWKRKPFNTLQPEDLKYITAAQYLEYKEGHS